MDKVDVDLVEFDHGLDPGIPGLLGSWSDQVEKEEIASKEFSTKRKMAVIRKGSHDLHYQHLAKAKDKGSLVSTCQKGFWEVFVFAVGGRGCHQGCSSHHSLNF